MFNKYKFIFWDFDGVILNSNNVRSEGFKFIFREFDTKYVDKLISFHEQNGGLSRYFKINYFFEKIVDLKISDEKFKFYLKEYSTFCLSRLCDNKLLIEDSVSFIKKNQVKYHHYIISASDEIELNVICKKQKIATYFKSIHGSPISKSDNLKILINKNKINPKDCCLIGDSVNDRNAAIKNKIDFFGYNNNNLKINSNYIEYFYLPNQF